MIRSASKRITTPTGVRLHVVAFPVPVVPDHGGSCVDLCAYADGRPVKSRSVYVELSDRTIRSELDAWCRELSEVEVGQ